MDLRSHFRHQAQNTNLRRMARPQIQPALHDGTGITLSGNPLRATNVSNEALGTGDGVFLAADSGVAQQERRRFKRNENRAIIFKTGNPDVKQLVFVGRNILVTVSGEYELWVRSPTAAIQIDVGHSDQRPYAASLTSTGPKITDFVVLVQYPSGLWRFDGMRKTQIYRGTGRYFALALYLAPLIRMPHLVMISKRGFWVSVANQPHTYAGSGTGSPVGTFPIIQSPDVFTPPFAIGTYTYNETFGENSAEIFHVEVNYNYNAYWQAGSSVVQQSVCSLEGYYDYIFSANSSYSGSMLQTENFIADENGTIESRLSEYFPDFTIDQGFTSGDYSGKVPVAVGTRESKTRLVFNYDQLSFEFIKDSVVLGQINSIFFSENPSLIQFSNSYFDEKFVWLGRLGPLNRNKVIEKKYPISNAYQAGFEVTQDINFFEIPNTNDLDFFTVDPASANIEGSGFWAIAYDRGEKIGKLYPHPDSPPLSGPGGDNNAT